MASTERALEHLVITRFNLPWGHGSPNLDAGWLERRLALFKRFCFPSMVSQTDPNFRWLLLLDARTPEHVRRQVDELDLGGRLVRCYLDSPDRRAVARRAAALLQRQTTHVITTTVDNDDALARDFVARVQAELRDAELDFVNFPRGYRLLLPAGRLYSCELASNPFFSVVEPVDRMQTVFGYLPHSTLTKRHPVRDVWTAPLWLQVVHGDNLAPTSAFGRQRISRTELARRFTLEVDVTAGEPGPQIALENLWRRAQRAALNRVPDQLAHRLRTLSRRTPGR